MNKIANLGLKGLAALHVNLGTAALYEQALRRNEAQLSAHGALIAYTGQHTGRSPNDKFIVEDAQTSRDIWWGKVNRPISQAHYAGLLQKMREWCVGRELFAQDLFAGAAANYRLPIRVITQNAWHSLFARNMFIRPQPAEIVTHEPQFTVLHLPEFLADPRIDGTQSSTFIIINFAERMVLIGGTAYAGEIKKSIFSVMNYLLPAQGILPMHASANSGPAGDVAVFFGLSGTGKTTLSADPARTLIGDDEHGWSQDGVFNFEGGCYAKLIRLSAKAEPEIYATTQRFGTIVENVPCDARTRLLDLDSTEYTENTRASYPLDFIPNASTTGMGGLPQNIIMLTADAFGVLPPLAKLSPEQAMYHFLSGYTARVAGTERGVTTPQAAFSACFGAPFLPRHPQVYAKMLGEKLKQHKVNCWLVNTGWTGGAYGTGQRMPIDYTRALLHSALDGSLSQTQFAPEPYFGLMVPESCKNVPSQILRPESSWADAQAYQQAARQVAHKFAINFAEYAPHVDDAVRAIAIAA